MTKVLDVSVPGEVHARAVPGGVEVGIAVDGRTVAWKPLSPESALEAANALDGLGDGFEDAGFLAGRRGGMAYLSFLGLAVRMDGEGASRVASALRSAACGEGSP